MGPSGTRRGRRLNAVVWDTRRFRDRVSGGRRLTRPRNLRKRSDGRRSYSDTVVRGKTRYRLRAPTAVAVAVARSVIFRDRIPDARTVLPGETRPAGTLYPVPRPADRWGYAETGLTEFRSASNGYPAYTLPPSPPGEFRRTSAAAADTHDAAP